MEKGDFALIVKNGIIAKIETNGLDSLSLKEKIVELVSTLDYETTQGGLYSYYYNTSGSQAIEVIEALNAIGAKKAANIMKEINELFRNGMPPKNHEERRKELHGLVQPLEEYTEKLYNSVELFDLIDDYIIENREDFSQTNNGSPHD